MFLTIKVDRETDGRWIAEVTDLPGCMVYSTAREDAIEKVKTLALRVLAERREFGEPAPEPIFSLSHAT